MDSALKQFIEGTNKKSRKKRLPKLLGTKTPESERKVKINEEKIPDSPMSDYSDGILIDITNSQKKSQFLIK